MNISLRGRESLSIKDFMMQLRRAIFVGLAGTILADKALAKARPEADDGQAPGICPRCGRAHGKLNDK